jgi:hypothetical protein
MTTAIVTLDSDSLAHDADTGIRAVAPSVRFPDRFQGIFARLQPRLQPLIVDARRELAALNVLPEVQPYYAYGVLEHAQPSFMLLPLMFLTIADYSGGIHHRHRAHLPWLMLSMEACAILDDTVDHTPFRSGRPSYPGRFGSASAAPFAAFLVSVVIEKTHATEPRILPLVIDMFRDLCALETWEVGSRYPQLTEGSMAHWLACRYAEVTPAVIYGLDSALVLQDAARLPPRVSTLFAEIFQDVDDLVNFAENREREGENDDLKMGMVTHLLLSTLRAQPSLAGAVARMWDECRALREAGALDELARRSPRDRGAVVDAIARHGVPATVGKIIADAQACIEETPVSLRPMMEEMVLTFVDRLRRVDMLRDVVAAYER